jgi:hypothetical protein
MNRSRRIAEILIAVLTTSVNCTTRAPCPRDEDAVRLAVFKWQIAREPSVQLVCIGLMPESSSEVVSPEPSLVQKISGDSARVKTWAECRGLRSQEAFAGRQFVVGHIEWSSAIRAEVDGLLPGTAYRYELSCAAGNWHVEGAWRRGDAHVGW